MSCCTPLTTVKFEKANVSDVPRSHGEFGEFAARRMCSQNQRFRDGWLVSQPVNLRHRESCDVLRLVFKDLFDYVLLRCKNMGLQGPR
eukprot:7775062-Pyramimonas_sp.AAC.2